MKNLKVAIVAVVIIGLMANPVSVSAESIAGTGTANSREITTVSPMHCIGPKRVVSYYDIEFYGGRYVILCKKTVYEDGSFGIAVGSEGIMDLQRPMIQQIIERAFHNKVRHYGK